MECLEPHLLQRRHELILYLVSNDQVQIGGSARNSVSIQRERAGQGKWLAQFVEPFANRLKNPLHIHGWNNLVYVTGPAIS